MSRLPEDTLDLLELRGSGLTQEEELFLIHKVETWDGGFWDLPGKTAVRTLGILGEEKIFDPKKVIRILEPLLKRKSALVRVTVIEAFWQLADPDALPLLESLDRSELIGVSETLNHVIKVLKRRLPNETE